MSKTWAHRGAMALLVVLYVAGYHTQPPRPSAGALDQYRRYYLSQSDAQSRNGAIKVTFLGTTTLPFDDGQTQLMIDGFFTRPVITSMATMIQTDPAKVDAALARAKVDRLAAQFVAQSHFDHALDVAYVVQRTGAKLYGSGRRGRTSVPPFPMAACLTRKACGTDHRPARPRPACSRETPRAL